MDQEKARKMCYSKKKFMSVEEAELAAINSSRKFGPMRVYKCPICHKWHLTHTNVEVF